MKANRPETVYFLNRVLDDAFELKNLWKFFLVNLVIATAVVLSFCPNCFFSWELFTGVWDDWLYSFLISSLLSGGITLIIRFSEKMFPWLEKPVQRLLFDLTAVVIYSFVVSFILGTIFALWIWDYFTFDQIGWADIAESTKLPTYIALGLTVFFTSRAFLIEWKQAVIEAERIKREHLAGQYQSLKNQLNPHFLFNSLNVLSNLVYEDADQSNAFIEKLSAIYRYVLDVQNEELIDLEEEIAFAQKYMELQAIRFGKKFHFAFEFSDPKAFCIPPLTLQLLIENAFKHNIATKDSPLDVFVIQNDDRLIVKNTLQRRKVESAESGIGLENIRKRCAFFTDREVIVKEEGGFFVVDVPLIIKSNNQ